MIVIHHVTTYLLPTSSLLLSQHTALFSNSYLWVDTFFILSGFILTHVYKKQSLSKNNYLIFIISRFARIYPLHFVVLLSLAALETMRYVIDGSGFGSTRSIESLLENTFLLQAIQIDARSTTWNHPSWTISAEWHVYLLFPIILALIKKINLLQQTIILFLSFSVLFFVNRATQWELDVTGYLGLTRCLFEALIGSTTYILINSRTSKREYIIPKHSPLIIIAIILLTLHYDFIDLFIVSLMLILVTTLFLENKNHNSALKSRPLIYLGNISYSIYITHFLTFEVMRIFTSQILNFNIANINTPALLIISGILTVCIVILTSIATYNFIEVPIRTYIKNKLNNTKRI